MVRELAETSTKDLHVWRVLLSSCSNCGVLLSWVFWPGGSVQAGETARAGNFETSNPLTECQKVDTEGDLSFCSSSKLFRDRTPWYECRICIVSSALTYFLIVIIAQWDMMWSKWGEKFKGGRWIFCTCSKGEWGRKNVGLQWVEIFSEVSSVRGKYCTLFENEKRGFLFLRTLRWFQSLEFRVS